MIKTILIIFFIKDVKFTVYLSLIYVFSYPEVDFAAIWPNRDLCAPIISVMSPLLSPVSDDIIVNCSNSKCRRRSNYHEPGWVSKSNLCRTLDCNNKNAGQDQVCCFHTNFSLILSHHEISFTITYFSSWYWSSFLPINWNPL